MYKFRMSIGDWSGDGHGKYKDFMIVSNEPIDTVREAHRRMEDVLGFSIEDFCCDYEDSTIDKKTTKTIMDLGFDFEDIDDGVAYMYPKEMARLWAFLLQKVNPKLELEMVDDNISRLCEGVGYGLFW